MTINKNYSVWLIITLLMTNIVYAMEGSSSQQQQQRQIKRTSIESHRHFAAEMIGRNPRARIASTLSSPAAIKKRLDEDLAKKAFAFYDVHKFILDIPQNVTQLSSGKDSENEAQNVRDYIAKYDSTLAIEYPNLGSITSVRASAQALIVNLWSTVDSRKAKLDDPTVLEAFIKHADYMYLADMLSRENLICLTQNYVDYWDGDFTSSNTRFSQVTEFLKSSKEYFYIKKWIKPNCFDLLQFFESIVIDCSNNKLALPSLKTKLRKLAMLSNLKELELCNCELKELPAEVGLLRNLEDLDVSRNRLVVLPDSLSKCAYLETLHIYDNPAPGKAADDDSDHPDRLPDNTNQILEKLVVVHCTNRRVFNLIVSMGQVFGLADGFNEIWQIKSKGSSVVKPVLNVQCYKYKCSNPSSRFCSCKGQGCKQCIFSHAKDSEALAKRGLCIEKERILTTFSVIPIQRRNHACLPLFPVDQ